MAQDDHGTEGDWLHQRQDDMTVNLPLIGAVHPGGFAQFLGNGAQTAQIKRHHVTGHLPDGRDGNEGDAPHRCGVPVVDQKIQPEFVEQQVKPAHAGALGWIHQPAPDHAGHDVGNCHREQKDGAEDGLPFEVLVQQDGQDQAQQQRAGDKQDGKDGGVAHVHLEAGVFEQFQVVVEQRLGPGVVGHQPFPLAQRYLRRPADEAINEDGHRHNGGQHHQHPDQAVSIQFSAHRASQFPWGGSGVSTPWAKQSEFTCRGRKRRRPQPGRFGRRRRPSSSGTGRGRYRSRTSRRRWRPHHGSGCR